MWTIDKIAAIVGVVLFVLGLIFAVTTADDPDSGSFAPGVMLFGLVLAIITGVPAISQHSSTTNDKAWAAAKQVPGVTVTKIDLDLSGYGDTSATSTFDYVVRSTGQLCTGAVIKRQDSKFNFLVGSGTCR